LADDIMLRVRFEKSHVNTNLIPQHGKGYQN
jgi:hypothetical protein